MTTELRKISTQCVNSSTNLNQVDVSSTSDKVLQRRTLLNMPTFKKNLVQAGLEDYG